MGQRGDRFAKVLQESSIVDRSKLITSGKFRRYANENLLQRLLDIRTILLNAIDAFKVCIGILQAWLLVRKERPDVIVSKSGPASLPLGIAAKLLHVPLITHDSDAIPGLAHRVVGKWAVCNAVANRAGTYPYDKDKLVVTGLPIDERFTQPIGRAEQAAAKKHLKVGEGPLVFVFAGSLGAQSVNRAMLAISRQLTEEASVVHVTGERHYRALSKQADEIGLDTKYYRLLPYVEGPDKVHEYYAAADVVVARAGATTTSELSGMAKASVIVPAAQLSDQLQNALHLGREQAAAVLQDQELAQDPETLLKVILELLHDHKKAAELARNLNALFVDDAAETIADLILKQGNETA